MSKPTFDRVRPRTGSTDRGSTRPSDSEGRLGMVDGEIRVPDREGKRALFSGEPEPPTLGSVAITCTRCEARSVVPWGKALRLAFPSVPALVPGAGVRIWMRCRTCRNRTWNVLSLRY